MQKVIVIVGQTAVGKTSLSIKLAKHFNAEIINGDALQVYKELNIITDKISEEKMDGVKHHLLSIKSIDESYSVEEYQRNIRKVIDEVSSRGIIPFIVGGTGLYIKACLYDYSFNKEDVSNKEIEEKYKDVSNEDLYKYLLSIDPKACETIHQNNRRRVLRAIAIYESSGISKSETIDSQKHEMIYDALFIGLTGDKDLLNKKMDDRIEQMFDEGVIEEVRNNPSSETASKAIGYKEITSYLNNEISLEEAKNLMKIHTHQYAKRQRTWFKNQFDVNWFDLSKDSIDDIINLIESWMNK